MCKSFSLYILFSLIIFQIVGCAPAAVVSAPVAFADRRATEIPVSYTHLTLPTICSV